MSCPPWFLLVFLFLSTSALSRELKEITDSGTLWVATRQSDLVFHSEDENKASESHQLHHALLLKYAATIGVKVQFILIKQVKDYWSDGKGIVSEGNVYSPSLFSKVDLYMDSLTVLDWREKLAKPIPYMSVKEVFLCNFQDEVSIIDEVKKKRIKMYTIGATSFHTILLHLGLTDSDIQFENSMEDVRTKTSEPKERACMVDDSDVALFQAKNNKNLFFVNSPSTNIKQLAWWTANKDKKLHASLTHFWKKIKSDGTWEALFSNSYGMEFSRYIKIISKL